MSRPAHREQNGPPRTERLTTSRSKKQTDWTARQHSDITRRAAWDVVIWGWRKPQFQVLCYLLSINNMTEVNFSISLWPTSCITWIKHLVVTGQQDAHTNIHHVCRPWHWPWEVVWRHQERGDPKSSCKLDRRDWSRMDEARKKQWDMDLKHRGQLREF